MAYHPSMAMNHVTAEVPSGTVNGSNKDFTLAHTPLPGSMSVYVGIGTAVRTTAFSVAGATISMTVAPALTALIFVDYRY